MKMLDIGGEYRPKQKMVNAWTQQESFVWMDDEAELLLSHSRL